MGSAQVLSGNPALSEEHRDILLKIIEQTERIEFLLKSLLNFAQPPKPNFLLINVNEVFEKTISLAEKHPLFLLKKSRVIIDREKLRSPSPENHGRS